MAKFIKLISGGWLNITANAVVNNTQAEGAKECE